MKKLIATCLLGFNAILFSHAQAAEVNSLTASESLNRALQDQKENQSAFNATYKKISDDTYLDVSNNVILQKQQLLEALHSVINQQANYGNNSVVKALQRIMTSIEVQDPSFEDAYRAEISESPIDTHADLEALDVLRQTISRDFGIVQNKTNQWILQEQQKVANIEHYLSAHPSVFFNASYRLPNVSDGSPVKVFWITDECYFINAGSYSDINIGDTYAVSGQSGEYLGNIKIVRASGRYSAGVLLQSIGVGVGDGIPELKTKSTEYGKNQS